MNGDAALLSGLRFEEPGWLWAALALAAALAWGLRRGPAARRVPGGPVHRVPLPRTWRTRLRALPAAMAMIAWLLAAVALAGPWRTVTDVETAEGVDVLLCLDRSSSMEARDLDPERSRLEVARAAARTFVAARPRDRIGLLSFARYPDVLCPLTLDHRAVARILEDVTLVPPDDAEDATGIGTALVRAAQVLEEAQARSRVIVLLTDGEETVAQGGGGISPGAAAAACADLGVRVHAIAVGVGTRERGGARIALDHGPLRAVAERTGGAFFEARNADALTRVYATIDALETAVFERSVLRRESASRSVLVVALGIAALASALAFGALRRAPDGDAERRRVRAALCLAAWACGAAAAAWPGARADEESPPAAEVLFLLDVSRSMLARDVAPSRLEHARARIAELAERLPAARVGLLAFAGSARLLCPLTEDRATFAGLTRLAVPASVPQGGTDLGAALQAARAALADAGSADGVLVVVSDGEDLEGGGARALESFGDDAPEVHAVGVGTARGAKIPVETADGTRFLRDASGEDVVTALDAAGLRAVARATGGRYYDAAEDASAWTRLAARLGSGASPEGGPPAAPRGLHRLLLLLALGCGIAAAGISLRESVRR